MSVNANLRTRIAEADTSIAGLNREIDAALGGLKLRLKGVQDVRRRLQFELDAIVYRVENLPHELTAEIFLQCLPSPSELSHPHKHHPTKSTAPLVFLEVCRAWRNVALATPRLWADLQLDLDEFPEGTDEDELEVLAAEWFGRAGTCPRILTKMSTTIATSCRSSPIPVPHCGAFPPQANLRCSRLTGSPPSCRTSPPSRSRKRVAGFRSTFLKGWIALEILHSCPICSPLPSGIPNLRSS
ncbi:hypothetical protein C8R46DRAFT_1141468 [Mycena filopes]|nr:hypothetical protein C8R46DRAFT_1141468 [Mycena filopes]